MKFLSGAARRIINLVRERPSNASYIQYLQAVATEPAIVALRARAFECLQLKNGDHVLDLGCGPGTVTVQLAARVGASGRVQGIDIDAQMIDAANALAAQERVSQRVSHHIGDCTRLSLHDDLFDACYCERVFQHLSGDAPLRAAAQIVRILKPGGRFLLLDTIWSSVSIHTDDSVRQRVVDACLRRFANPDAGAHLAHWMSIANGLDLQVETAELPVSHQGSTAALFSSAARLALKPRELALWSAGLDVARERQQPFATISMVMVSGVKAG